MSARWARTRSYAVRAGAAVTGLTLLVACSGPASSGEGAATTSADTTLTVFAAASLQTPFEAIGAAFEEANPGTTVRFGFGGSSGLVAQLTEGAPADVLATANEATMTTAESAGLLAGTPRPFATNVLQIAVPADNPRRVDALADLADPATKVVLCAPAVPCGAASLAVEKAAGIDITPVSEEQSVTDVLGKVRSGEADAGLVYVTDVRGAGDSVRGIDFPEAAKAVNTYPIATLKGSENASFAIKFVAAVTSPDGQRVLRDAGFSPATP
ncbi:molybdate transport system substrate-binding protein [Knoellia remsis]|uniref:Molybdate transport system substrate-binding protein n=1 Tax=Knoellia remsis TaxID=407159 RepID=A0A2T0UQ93_9MICO|nr:molybdate ABC transporter substrate-binding protein [Knoellia remsis]PRY60074.1 molybdate transport system substrate-binding protein [Knoellia remsis]